jgi:beta-phosphoglucomutase-like phosphatase (HAD superfamily)
MKRRLQAVFFDFDGVILDSVDVKARAFSEMFRDYGPEVEKAVVD